jgi:hypothetical protein
VSDPGASLFLLICSPSVFGHVLAVYLPNIFSSFCFSMRSAGERPWRPSHGDKALHFNFMFYGTERKRIEKPRYMHRNPVKRGLVASPELWNWSSFRAYALGEAGPVRVDDWEVLKMKVRPPAA